MRRSIFLLFFTLILGISFALSVDDDAKASKSSETKKDAKGCCMQGAKAENASKDEGTSHEARVAAEVKHAAHKHTDGDMAKAHEDCASPKEGCDSKENEDGCCSKGKGEVKSEKKAEKPLR